MKILIVEDDEYSRVYLEILLSGTGYSVLTAANGAEGLEKALGSKPDMIISDILMPVMDGFSLCRKCKSHDNLKAIPFIFYTATYTDPRDRELALDIGAARFLIKPMEPDPFIEILEDVIKEYQDPSAFRLREPIVEEQVHFKKYNEALIRKLEDKMALISGIFENTSGIIMVLSPDHKIIKFNPAVEQLYGVKAEEVLGQDFLELFVSKDMRPEIEKSIQKVMQGQLTQHFENDIITKHSKLRRLLWNVNRFKASQGNIKGIVAIGIDITKRREAEKRLKKTLSELKVIKDKLQNENLYFQRERYPKYTSPFKVIR